MRHSSVYKSPYSPVSFGFKTFLKTAKMGSQPVVFASVCADVADVSGKLFRGFQIDFHADQVGKEVANREVATRLWRTSEKWTRLGEASEVVHRK